MLDIFAQHLNYCKAKISFIGTEESFLIWCCVSEIENCVNPHSVFVSITYSWLMKCKQILHGGLFQHKKTNVS